MRTLLALVPLALAASTAAAQTLGPAEIRRIDSVFAPLDGTGRPGCAVGVSRNGVPVYTRGFGMSDLQHGVPITPQSIFHVASVSKQFAAFAVALLAEDGKLSLDDEVRRWVPELPDYGTRITIRHLIYHTSGIRDQWELLSMAGWRYPADLFTQDDVLDIVSRQKELNFPPGSEWVYSNSGYTLLAIIAKRVSGKSLREFSQERIFGPLGMTRTHVHDDHAEVVPGRTSAYEMGPRGWKVSTPTFDTHGATSLFTTVEDLLKWQQNFVSGTVGSRALLTEAETSAKLTNGKPANYGFGISTEVYRGAKAFGHGGADAGYRADVVRFPEHGLAVSVACNFADALPGQYARAVADVLLEGRLEPKPAAPTVAKAGPASVSAARLAQIAGVYKSPTNDQAFAFAVRDGKLVLTNYGVPLEPVDDTHFSVFGITAEFTGPATATPTGIRLVAGSMVVDSMARINAAAPTRDQLALLAGDYWSPELRVSYRVELTDAGLVLHRFKHPKVGLQPAYQDAFLGGEAGTVRFVRTKGRVTGFRLTGGRVRNVEFTRAVNRP
ncbi:MAG: beta-lactamase family protein [Gemmatimonadetes bacterium]|nr:beta-lactamase family protein [Gemmatimonadota bacterium]